MTANQIAYHDSQTRARGEDEIERHNRVTEDLDKEELRLRNLIAENENRWQTQKNDIQREYNDAYLRLQQAQGEEKLRIERLLAEIQDRRNTIQQFYNTEDIALRQTMADLQASRDQEVARFNNLDYNLRRDANTLAKSRLEYERSRDLLDRQLRMNELDFKRINLGNLQYQFEKQYTLDMYNTLLKGKLTNSQLREMESNIFRNYVSPFTNLLNTTTGTLPLLFKFP